MQRVTTIDEQAGPSPATRISANTKRATMAVYAAMTMMGVIAAASYKGYIASGPELILVVLGTSSSIVIAHAWAAVVAHRLVKSHRFTREEIVDEFTLAGAFFAPSAIVVALVVIFAASSISFADLILIVEIVLIATLFVVGLIGSRRAGASWIRSVFWATADAMIGVLILSAKLLLG